MYQGGNRSPPWHLWGLVPRVSHICLDSSGNPQIPPPLPGGGFFWSPKKNTAGWILLGFLFLLVWEGVHDMEMELVFLFDTIIKYDETKSWYCLGSICNIMIKTKSSNEKGEGKFNRTLDSCVQSLVHGPSISPIGLQDKLGTSTPFWARTFHEVKTCFQHLAKGYPPWN